MRTRHLAVFATFIVALGSSPSAFAQQPGYYVLDGFGGVHAGGGAPAVGPGIPYFGFDIAKDIVYVPPNPGAAASGIDGVLVLDGFGGVHAGGGINGLSIAPVTPYFGFNIARAITLHDHVPPRSGSAVGGGTISSTSYVSAASVTIHAPRAGRLILMATGEVFCTGAGDAGARFSVAVDTTSPGPTYPIGILDCSTGAPGTPADFQRSHSFTFTRSFTVSAGSHTGHLLARKEGGSLNFSLTDTMLTVIFVD